MTFFWGALLVFISLSVILDIIFTMNIAVKSKGITVCSVLEFSNNDNSIEYIIRETIKKYQWHNSVYSFSIYIVDKGMSADGIAICKKLMGEYDCIYLFKDKIPETLLR